MEPVQLRQRHLHAQEHERQELKEAFGYAWREFYNWKSVRRRLAWRKPFRFPLGSQGLRSPLRVRNLIYWAGNIGISRVVQQHFREGERTRALGAPESGFEQMRRAQGLPLEVRSGLGARDPDSVPGAGELVILRSGRVDRPAGAGAQPPSTAD